MRLGKGKILFAVLAAGFLFSAGAFATEFGGGSYPNGADDFMLGALPPPGTYILNYTTCYTANKFKSSLVPPDFKLQVFADVFRIVHVTRQQVLGASWAMHAFIPVACLDVTMGGQSDNKWGLGDIIIDPFILGWHSKNWHTTTGLDIYLPTGAYSSTDLANIGRNYWTFEPVVAFTYIGDSGFEVSTKFMYDFNTENDDTDYSSGQEFHMDYTVGRRISKNCSLGLGGYWYAQMTDDKVNGITVGTDGFKGNVVGVGPQVKFDWGKKSLILKYQKEFCVDNKPEGDKFWLKFVAAL